MQYEPSIKVVHAFLDPEIPKALSLPLAALITGALSQVEATIELANRVYDSVFAPGQSERECGSGQTSLRAETSQIWLSFQTSTLSKRSE